MSDYSNLADELEAALVPLLKKLGEGSGDLADLAKTIALEAAAAAVAGDTEARDELKAQLRVLAEIQRIRLDEASWEIVEKIVGFGISAIAIALKGVA